MVLALFCDAQPRTDDHHDDQPDMAVGAVSSATGATSSNDSHAQRYHPLLRARHVRHVHGFARRAFVPRHRIESPKAPASIASAPTTMSGARPVEAPRVVGAEPLHPVHVLHAFLEVR